MLAERTIRIFCNIRKVFETTIFGGDIKRNCDKVDKKTKNWLRMIEIKFSRHFSMKLLPDYAMVA